MSHPDTHQLAPAQGHPTGGKVLQTAGRKAAIFQQHIGEGKIIQTALRKLAAVKDAVFKLDAAAVKPFQQLISVDAAAQLLLVLLLHLHQVVQQVSTLQRLSQIGRLYFHPHLSPLFLHYIPF